MWNKAASLRQGYGRHSSGVLAILPCSRTPCTLRASKWLRPYPSGFLQPPLGQELISVRFRSVLFRRSRWGALAPNNYHDTIGVSLLYRQFIHANDSGRRLKRLGQPYTNIPSIQTFDECSCRCNSWAMAFSTCPDTGC